MLRVQKNTLENDDHCEVFITCSRDIMIERRVFYA